ncbi:MAG: RHS repeat domain-containing protein [Fimbriimonas sp.]
MAGHILGEQNGSQRLDYLPDALGNIVAAVDQAKMVQHTARYKPYGAELAITGIAPMFGWIGTLGYCRTGLACAEIYVRARHYGINGGRWNSVDPLWPYEAAYIYVRGKVVAVSDPSGLGPFVSDSCTGKIDPKIIDGIETMFDDLCRNLSSKADQIRDCVKGLPANVDTMACLAKRCQIKGIIKCEPTDDASKTCYRSYKYTCRDVDCNGKVIVKTIKMPACAETMCTTSSGNVDQRAASPVNWCPYFFNGEFQAECNNGTAGGCGTGSNNKEDPTGKATMMHEALHACVNCNTPSSHTRAYNDAAKCIIALL